MREILIPAIAALGLVTTAAHTRSNTPDSLSGQAVAWHLSHDGERAKLAFGVANSDQLALMMTCAAGDTDVAIYGDVQPIGANMPGIAGPEVPDPLSGGDASEITLPLSDAGFADLSRRGRMVVTSDGQVFQLAATQQERRIVDRFLAYCRTGQA